MSQMVWTAPAPGVLYQVSRLGAVSEASTSPTIAPTSANTPMVFRDATFTQKLLARLTPRAGREYASGTDGPRTSCRGPGDDQHRLRGPDPRPRLPPECRHRCDSSLHSVLYGGVRLH